MDERLQVKDAPREVSLPVPLQMPLLAVGWRILRAEHARRAQEKRHTDAEGARTQTAFVAFADELFRLKRLVTNLANADDKAAKTNPAAQLAPIVDRLEAALADAGVALVAGVGQPYTDELLHFLENVAQRPAATIDEPYVEEVLIPAVVYRGSPLRMGKAVIAVPAQDEQQESPAATV